MKIQLIYGKMEFYQVVGVNECDRAIDFLRTPVVLSIADVDLLHTRATQSLTYLDTCGEVDSAGSYSDCVGGKGIVGPLCLVSSYQHLLYLGSVRQFLRSQSPS
jgi:hypothetical protein